MDDTLPGPTKARGIAFFDVDNTVLAKNSATDQEPRHTA